MLKLGNNLLSNTVRSQLDRSTEEVRKISERLSSGQRINRASDDAAGLSIASSLEFTRRVSTQAIRNINDGISALSIADGALQELSRILVRQQELTSQAANGVFTREQRVALQDEGDALTSEFNRIVNSTKFNKEKIFSVTNGELRLQAGVGTGNSLAISIVDAFSRKKGIGTFTSDSTDSINFGQSFGGHTGDFNNDGYDDIFMASSSIYYGNASGTLTESTGVGNALALADLDGDGNLDVLQTSGVLFGDGNGGGTYVALTSSISGAVRTGDIDGDGDIDIVATGAGADSVYENNGDRTFTRTSSASLPIYALEIGDFNDDGAEELYGIEAGVLRIYSYSEGSFTEVVSTSLVPNFASLSNFSSFADYNRDGILDFVGVSGSSRVVQSGQTDGTFTAGQTLTANGSYLVDDVNADGAIDLLAVVGTNVTTYFNDGEGNFSIGGTDTFSAPAAGSQTGYATGDFNGDGAADFFVFGYESDAAGALEFYSADTEDFYESYFFNLATVDSARSAFEVIEAEQERVSQAVSQIGAFLSRIYSTSSVLEGTALESERARARILDVDVASEVANLTRESVRQEASASLLAQANLVPELVLSLLEDLNVSAP